MYVEHNRPRSSFDKMVGIRLTSYSILLIVLHIVSKVSIFRNIGLLINPIETCFAPHPLASPWLRCRCLNESFNLSTIGIVSITVFVYRYRIDNFFFSRYRIDQFVGLSVSYRTRFSFDIPHYSTSQTLTLTPTAWGSRKQKRRKNLGTR